MDDIIVFSKTLEEYETRLTNVLCRLWEDVLKLSLEKCSFFSNLYLLSRPYSISKQSWDLKNWNTQDLAKTSDIERP